MTSQLQFWLKKEEIMSWPQFSFDFLQIWCMSEGTKNKVWDENSAIYVINFRSKWRLEKYKIDTKVVIFPNYVIFSNKLRRYIDFDPLNTKIFGGILFAHFLCWKIYFSIINYCENFGFLFIWYLSLQNNKLTCLLLIYEDKPTYYKSFEFFYSR